MLLHYAILTSFPLVLALALERRNLRCLASANSRTTTSNIPISTISTTKPSNAAVCRAVGSSSRAAATTTTTTVYIESKSTASPTSSKISTSTSLSSPPIPAAISTSTQLPLACSTPPYRAAHSITGTGTLPKPTSFVKRSGKSLTLDGSPFHLVGPNIYWLCQDENIADVPKGTPPTKDRVREALAIAVAMGATTIRALSCGISVGSLNSLEPSLNNFGNFDAHDYAIFAAGQYGLRIIITLVDVFDYYTGGEATFLRWNGVSTDNDSNFFYTNSKVIDSFSTYVDKLVSHVNPYNALKWGEDPTVVAWETGNELGGYIGKYGYPPASWTSSIIDTIKKSSTQQLILDGADGFYNYSTKATSPSLNIDRIDLMSDHGYPRNLGLLRAEEPLTSKANKGFFVGEYDWAGNDGSSLPDYLTELESGKYVGDMMWNIMGHDSNCCDFVKHDDGYSAYYPNGNTASLQANLLLVVQHFYRVQGLTVPQALVGVSCPQPVF